MIYRRGKKWWYEFVWRGQRIREAGGRTKEQARNAESNRRTALASGTATVAALPRLAEACRQTQAERQMSDRCRHDNARLQAVLCRSLGRLRLDEIGAREVERYRQARLAAVSPATVNREVSALRVVMRRWGQWEKVAARLRQLPERETPGVALTREEEARLLAACTGRRERLRAMIVLSVDTGLRASELRGLRWEDVAEDLSHLVVRRSKTAAGTGRGIPLSERAAAALGPRPAAPGLVFARGEKGPGSWRRAWRGALAEAGLKLRWHDLRHTACSRLAEAAGTADGTIKAIMGHSAARMVERYSHVSMAAKRQAISAAASPQKSPQGALLPFPPRAANE